MEKDDDENDPGDASLLTEIICEDTNIIVNETKNLMVEAKSSFTILVCSLLLMSLLSILLSTWLAKTITKSPTSFGSIVSHYFGFDRNESESDLTWWTPVHQSYLSDKSKLLDLNTKEISPQPLKIPYNDHPNFHTIVLPLLFICSILLGILAFYARVKCTHRDFAWGAVPKIPLDRVDPTIQLKEIPSPAIDYTIVQGTNDQPVVFAVTEPLEPERETGDIIDEGTQYDSDDIPKVITHVSSAPQLSLNSQTVPCQSPIQDQQHLIELLTREPLPTLSPST